MSSHNVFVPNPALTTSFGCLKLIDQPHLDCYNLWHNYMFSWTKVLQHQFGSLAHPRFSREQFIAQPRFGLLKFLPTHDVPVSKFLPNHVSVSLNSCQPRVGFPNPCGGALFSFAVVVVAYFLSHFFWLLIFFHTFSCGSLFSSGRVALMAYFLSGETVVVATAIFVCPRMWVIFHLAFQ